MSLQRLLREDLFLSSEDDDEEEDMDVDTRRQEVAEGQWFEDASSELLQVCRLRVPRSHTVVR